jgi:hypothetical protein
VKVQESEHGNSSRDAFQPEAAKKLIDKQDIAVVRWSQIDELGDHNHDKIEELTCWSRNIYGKLYYK